MRNSFFSFSPYQEQLNATCKHLLKSAARFTSYFLKNVWGELSNYPTCYFEQILKHDLRKQQQYNHLAFHLSNYSNKTNKTCWESKDEFIRDVFLWTPIHGHTSVGRPA